MLGGPLERSGFPPPSGGFTPSRCGLFLLRRSQLRGSGGVWIRLFADEGGHVVVPEPVTDVQGHAYGIVVFGGSVRSVARLGRDGLV